MTLFQGIFYFWVQYTVYPPPLPHKKGLGTSLFTGLAMAEGEWMTKYEISHRNRFTVNETTPPRTTAPAADAATGLCYGNLSSRRVRLYAQFPHDRRCVRPSAVSRRYYFTTTDRATNTRRHTTATGWLCCCFFFIFRDHRRI